MTVTMNIVRSICKSLGCAAITVLASLCVSCTDKDLNFGIDGDKEGTDYSYPGNRMAHVESRRVLLFYECGFNSLYNYLRTNMEDDLDQGYLPGNGRNEDVVLVFSKLARNSNYNDVPSYLRRVYADPEGKVVSDTLRTFPVTTVASSPSTMSEVLNYVKTTFPAKGYGMVYSSHGSGWLPTGYYSSQATFERLYGRSDGRKLSAPRMLGVPEGTMETDDPHAGMVRSIGQDVMSSGSVEMSVSEFASGIPFHLDYLLFDMCFSAGAEVAYALRDKASYIGASPAEVLAAGMYDYTKITGYLLNGPSSPDLVNLFKDSFDRYDKQSGEYRSATVTLVKTDGLAGLASVCKTMFDRYATAISQAPVSSIQGYHRLGRHYFWDLEDTFIKCGASASDLQTLRNAISQCIAYRNATPSFLGDFDITTYSGFSIYLPCAGTATLDYYYKSEPWNVAVELVK